MRFIFLLIMVVCMANLNSQSLNILGFGELGNNPLVSYEMSENAHHFLMEEFVPGQIRLQSMPDSQLVDVDKANFDIQNGLLVIANKSEFFSIKSRYVSWAELKNKDESFILRPVHASYPNKLFLVHFEDDDFIFLEEQRIHVEKSQDLGIVNKPKLVSKKSSYYITNKKDLKSYEINLRKNNFLEYIPKASADRVRTFLRKNNIKLKKLKHYQSFFEKYKKYQVDEQ